MPGKRILLVEDNPGEATPLMHRLDRDGFDPTRVATLSKAREAIRNYTFSAIILDVGLPDGNGFDFCRELRTNDNNIPILFLTARNNKQDEIDALEDGGDEYLIKPVPPSLVSAHLKALLRRVEDPTPSMSNSQFHLDEDLIRITFRNQVLTLGNIEYKILRLLINRPGRVYSRDQILENCWPDDGNSVTNDMVVAVHIGNIRRKLENISPNCSPEEILKTKIGFGYYLVD